MKLTPSRSWPLVPLLVLAGCVTSGVTNTEPEPPPPPPPPRLTPDQETQQVVTAVMKSGDVPPDLQQILFRAAEAAFGETFDNPSPDIVQIERGGCFAGGCLFNVTYRDRCAADAFKARFTDVADTRLRSWPGSIYMTPPIRQPDGRIRVTWALLLDQNPMQLQQRRARLEALLAPVQPMKPAIQADVCAKGARPAGGPAGVRPATLQEKKPMPNQVTK